MEANKQPPWKKKAAPVTPAPVKKSKPPDDSVDRRLRHAQQNTQSNRVLSRITMGPLASPQSEQDQGLASQRGDAGGLPAPQQPAMNNAGAVCAAPLSQGEELGRHFAASAPSPIHAQYIRVFDDSCVHDQTVFPATPPVRHQPGQSNNLRSSELADADETPERISGQRHGVSLEQEVFTPSPLAPRLQQHSESELQ